MLTCIALLGLCAAAVLLTRAIVGMVDLQPPITVYSLLQSLYSA
jgi:hypothetical protein